MHVKTITYQRVLNLGNYESKRLEMSIEVDTFLGLAEHECSMLMECVDRKIHEDKSQEILEEIKNAKNELREINKEIESGKQLLAEIAKELNPDTPDEESIFPFDSEVGEGGDF